MSIVSDQLFCLHNNFKQFSLIIKQSITMISAIRHSIKSQCGLNLTFLRRFAAQASVNTTKSNLAEAPDVSVEYDKLYSKLEVELRGIDPAVLKSYSWFATTAAGHLDIEVGKCWAERKSIKDRQTLLKCVHIYKKHRVQYEIRTYIRYMIFHKLTGSTLDTFLEYIERNLPEGVALIAKKTEIQELPEHLEKPPATI